MDALYTMCVNTWAEHGFNIVDELLGHQVYEALHAHHRAIPLAGDTLQTLILLDLVEHVSDTDGSHGNAGIAAHVHRYTQTQAIRPLSPPSLQKC